MISYKTSLIYTDRTDAQLCACGSVYFGEQCLRNYFPRPCNLTSSNNYCDLKVFFIIIPKKTFVKRFFSKFSVGLLFYAFCYLSDIHSVKIRRRIAFAYNAFIGKIFTFKIVGVFFFAEKHE